MEKLVPFAARKRVLEKLDDSRVISQRGFRTEALLEFLSSPIYKRRTKWTDIPTLCKVFDGRNTLSTRQRMLKRVPQIYLAFLTRGYLLLRRYSDAGQIIGIKLFDPESETDIAFATRQIEKMKESCNRRDRRVDQAAKLAGVELNWDVPADQPPLENAS